MAEREQSQYIIHEIILTTGRFEGEEINIDKTSVELNIFEDIEKPYLTASMAIVDNVALKTAVGIRGNERVKIVIQATLGAPLREITFLVSDIAKEVSVNERTDIRVLNLVEEHAYVSSIKKFSKTYDNNPDSIIQKVLDDHLNIKMDSISVRPVGRRTKVVVPYLTPLETAEWIRDSMSTTSGSPFFLYKTFGKKQVQLNDLSTLMRQDPWNDQTPYIYGQAANNLSATTSGELEDQRAFFYIQSYRAGRTSSINALARAGAIGSYFNIADTTSATVYTGDDAWHQGIDTLEQFMIETDHKKDSGISIDDSLEFDLPNTWQRSVSAMPAKSFSSVCSSRAYTDRDGNAIYGYHDAPQMSDQKLKLKAASMRALLVNNTMSISVPGTPYLIRDDIGVGSIIKINFIANAGGTEAESEIDLDRSGNFLIYRIRHKFAETRYDIQMDIVKLTREVK